MRVLPVARQEPDRDELREKLVGFMNSDQQIDEIILVSEQAELFDDGGVKIIGALMQAPATTYQLALRLGLAPALVQGVINRFVDHGLVQQVESCEQRGRGEPTYTTEVRDLILALGNEDDRQRRLKVARILLNALQSDLIESLTHLGPDQLALLKLVQAPMPTVRARRFRDRLAALMEEFSEAETDGEKERYSLVVALYPLIDPDRA